MTFTVNVMKAVNSCHTSGHPWDETQPTKVNGPIMFAICPWDENTFNVAADGGLLSCLKYAHEHGFPDDQREG